MASQVLRHELPYESRNRVSNGGGSVSGTSSESSGSPDPSPTLETVVSAGLRSFRLWCILGIIGSVATSVTVALGYMQWALSHYESTADRYETGLDRLVQELNRSMEANTNSLKASIDSNTRQITLLREDTKDELVRIRQEVSGRNEVPSLEAIKGVVEESLGQRFVPAVEASD